MSKFGKRIGVACLALAGLITPLTAASPSPVGTWLMTTGESQFAITQCGDGGVLCAKLTWLDEESRQDEDLAGLLNTYVMEGARPQDANTWTGKVSYDGGTYDGSLELVDADTMKLQGCMGIFCKSMELTRI